VKRVQASLADRRLLPEGRLAGPMPWVIAIMTFLTILAAGAGIGLGNAVSGLSSQLAGRATIQIVEPNPDLREKLARAVLAELGRLAAVERAERVDDGRMRRLLQPWLGSAGLDGDLPIPTLIDIDLQRGAAADALPSVENAVKAIAPNARLDAHAASLAPLQGLLSTLRWLAVALVLLMAAAMGAAVVLASRSALVTHRPTIDVMHLMGATDGQVAHLFQRRAALDALFGSLLGFVCAALIVIALGGRLAAVGAALLDQGALGWRGWLTLILVPAAAVLLSMAVARVTVLRALAKMP